MVPCSAWLAAIIRGCSASDHDDRVGLGKHTYFVVRTYLVLYICSCMPHPGLVNSIGRHQCCLALPPLYDCVLCLGLVLVWCKPCPQVIGSHLSVSRQITAYVDVRMYVYHRLYIPTYIRICVGFNLRIFISVFVIVFSRASLLLHSLILSGLCVGFCTVCFTFH